jgi:hypothetical protein
VRQGQVDAVSCDADVVGFDARAKSDDVGPGWFGRMPTVVVDRILTIAQVELVAIALPAAV